VGARNPDFQFKAAVGALRSASDTTALISDARVQMASALSRIEFGLSLIELCNALQFYPASLASIRDLVGRWR
jgi:hypothetical protein